MMDWPDDADGDVLRNMAAHGHDFTSRCDIDFHVDFTGRTSPLAAIALLVDRFGPAWVEDSPEHGASVRFQVHDRVSYELVTAVQAEASRLMAPFEGVCEAWGAIVSPRAG